MNLLQPLLVNKIISASGSGFPWGPALVLAAIMLVAVLADAVRMFLLSRIAENVVYAYRRRLVRKITTLDMQALDSYRTGDLVSRVGSDTIVVRSAFSTGFVDFVTSIMMFVGAVAIMLYIDWPLFLIVVSVILVVGVVFTYASSKIQTYSLAAQNALGGLSADVERTVLATRTIRSSCAEKTVVDGLTAHAQEVRRNGLSEARAEAILSPVSNLAVQLLFLVIVGVGVLRVSNGSLSIADLASFLILLFMLINPVAQLTNGVVTVRSAMGAMARIQELLDDRDESAPERAVNTRHAGGSSYPPRVPPLNEPNVDSTLRFEDVSYRYSPNRPVLQDASFIVEEGSRTAIVGSSGAGKSTVLSLLEAFYPPESGTISFGATDITSMAKADLRTRISYVEQDAPILAGSVRENLLLGAPDATDEECLEALASVNLAERFTTANGLDTELGERGVRLSGGERQRLAIARCVLRKSEVMLFDEPTSSVDSMNEKAILDVLNSTSRRATILVVTHRLSSIAAFDSIIVMHEGRIMGQGAHNELLRNCPHYAEMVRLQTVSS